MLQNKRHYYSMWGKKRVPRNTTPRRYTIKHNDIFEERIDLLIARIDWVLTQ